MAVGSTRQQISRLENGHLGPDIDLVALICDHLHAGHRRRDAIMSAAADGWATGWWADEADRMGSRQVRYADLESGAKSIAEYAITLIPGLLQTVAFSAARMRSDPARQSPRFDPGAAVHARAERQHRLLAADGTTYDLVLDELAVRRPAADPATVGAQLFHIVETSAAYRRITIRVLPIAASIAAHTAPRSAYSIYRYPDPKDPVVVAVDTLATDLLVTEPDDVDAYLIMHGRLMAAALTPDESLELLTSAANANPPTTKE